MGWILKSLFEALLEVLGELFQALAGPFLDNFALDIGSKLVVQSGDSRTPASFGEAMSNIFKGDSFFDKTFSGIGAFCTALMILALMFIVIIMVIELMKAMTQAPGEAEHPLSIIARSLMAGAGVGLSYAIFVAFEWLFNKVYLSFLTINADTASTGKFTDFWSKGGNLDAFTSGPGTIAGVLLALIALVLVFVQFLRLLISVTERYVLLGILFYTCPLAFATLASKNTSTIFKQWFRMVISQFLLMIFAVFFINVFLIVLENGGGVSLSDGGMTYLAFVFSLYAWLLIGQKVDRLLNQIGLSAAQSAGNVLGAVMASGAAIGAMGFAAARTGHAVASGIGRFKTNPFTAAGQAAKQKREKTKATYRAGKAYEGDMMRDLAQTKAAENAATAKSEKKAFDDDNRVFADRAKVSGATNAAKVADYKLRKKEGIRASDIAAANLNETKANIAQNQAREAQGLNTDAGRRQTAEQMAFRQAAENASFANLQEKGISHEAIGKAMASAERTTLGSVNTAESMGYTPEEFGEAKAKRNASVYETFKSAESYNGGAENGGGFKAYIEDAAKLDVEERQEATRAANEFREETGSSLFETEQQARKESAKRRVQKTDEGADDE